MDDLPFWLKVMSALATPAIALLGFAIAWGQWTTARSKLILDLFERRQTVYNAFVGPIGQAIREGRVDTPLYIEFVKVVHQAKFLFGRDVMDYVNGYSVVLNKMGEATSMLGTNRLTGEQHEKYLRSHRELMQALSVFYEGLDKLMASYMLMDQKRPWTIARFPRWFAWALAPKFRTVISYRWMKPKTKRS